MRIPSGVTDRGFYFVAVDATDLKTRETGLTSFTVYRGRNGATPVAMTTPSVSEEDSTNMPGVYFLLADEDMTIDAGNDSEEMVFHITHAGMAPVTRAIELYRPKITAGNTLTVASGGALGTDAIDSGSLAATAISEIGTGALVAGDIDGYSLEEAMKISLAALAGVLAGAATTSITIKAADGSKTRITATVDADGNRSAVTLDETG